MHPFLASSPLRRATAWTVAAAIAAFAPSPPRAQSSGPDLVAVVVDGKRLATADETGLAVVTRDGTRHEGRAGMALQAGDRIDTGDAVAVIRYASGTELLISTNSGGRIGSLTDFSGEVFVKAQDLFEIDTAFVKAAGRSAAYLVKVSRNGRTAVTVVEGTVDVTSTKNAWPSLTVAAGTKVRAGEREPQTMRPTLAELSGVRKWVEQIDSLVPAPRDVSPKAVVTAASVVAAIAVAAAGVAAAHPPQYYGDPPCATKGLPAFPWPRPPQPSVTTIVPPYLLFGSEKSAATLEDVAARLEGAVERAGYREPRYLGVGCSGFAIVLDLEHIHADGSRIEGSGGFAPPTQEEAFSLAAFIQRLFYAPPGEYRQIVLLVSDQRMAGATAPPSDAQLRAITRDGVSSLPSAFAREPFGSRHVVQALIYEFEKGPRDGDATVIPPQGRLGASVHLQKAHLF